MEKPNLQVNNSSTLNLRRALGGAVIKEEHSRAVEGLNGGLTFAAPQVAMLLPGGRGGGGGWRAVSADLISRHDD